MYWLRSMTFSRWKKLISATTTWLRMWCRWIGPVKSDVPADVFWKFLMNSAALWTREILFFCWKENSLEKTFWMLRIDGKHATKPMYSWRRSLKSRSPSGALRKVSICRWKQIFASFYFCFIKIGDRPVRIANFRDRIRQFFVSWNENERKIVRFSFRFSNEPAVCVSSWTAWWNLLKSSLTLWMSRS